MVNVKRRRGLTLADVTTAVAIVGMIVAIGAPSIQRAALKSREARVKADLKAVRDAIDRMYADTGRLPGSISQLTQTTPPGAATWGGASNPYVSGTFDPGGVPAGTWRGPYLKRVPQLDPVFRRYGTGASPVGNVHSDTGFVYDGGVTNGARHWFRIASDEISTEGTAYHTW